MRYILKVSDFLNESIKEKMSVIDKKVEKINKMSSNKNIFLMTFFLSLLSVSVFFYIFSRYEEVVIYDLSFFGKILFLFFISCILMYIVVVSILFSNIRTNYILQYKGFNEEFSNNDQQFFPLNSLNTNFNIIVEYKNKLSPEILQVVENAYARGGFYNYEIILLKHVKAIEEKIQKDQMLVI